MNPFALAKIILKSRPILMTRLIKTLNELYRSAFVSTAVSEGIYELLREEPKSLEQLHDALGLESCQRELETWLDLGVGLRELGKDDRGYRLKGRLSRALAEPENDPLHGFLQARVEVIYDYIVKTPSALREKKRFAFDDAYGKVFARSSKAVEPMLLHVVERFAPRGEGARQLEVGCGSGTYIIKACEINPTLEVVGLEASASATDYARANIENAGLEDRVQVEAIDVRDYEDESGFDVITFYNLIYYFEEKERLGLLQHLLELLRPGGTLVLSTLTPGVDPSTATMNLWSSMTDGCGPLPRPDVLVSQLRKAGFVEARGAPLFTSSYLVFSARRAAANE